MKAIVLAGGGLTSWFVCGYLMQEGIEVEALVLDVGTADAALREAFVDTLRDHGVAVTVQNRKKEMAAYGLEIVRFQGRYPNGYWNNTSISRACFVSAAREHMVGKGISLVAHGCVAFGNDQRRMDRLFHALDPAIHVRALSAELCADGSPVSRSEMIDAIRTWFGSRSDEIDSKVLWSVDGSVLGCAHEGAPIESMSEGWRHAPFVMTRDPFEDTDCEKVTIEIEAGRVVRINDAKGDALSILTAANEIAGRHGIGRIGAMEDKISGNKIRGVYEAPGLTLLGEGYRNLYSASFSAEQLSALGERTAQYARDVYQGEYFSQKAAENRAHLLTATQKVSGAVSMLVRGGYTEIECMETSCDPGSIERRFDHGGVAWANISLLPA